MTLAREHGGSVCALAVEEPLPPYVSRPTEQRPTAAYFEHLLDNARTEAAAVGVMLQTEAVRGHASRAIVDRAEQIGADLIAVGQPGHAGVLDRMLGSTSDRIIDTARCAVLVVPSEPRQR